MLGFLWKVFKFGFKVVWKISIFVLLLAILVMVAFNWPVKSKNEQMSFGISFSPRAVEGLGISDWKKAYIEILDELKPEKIRLAAYWNNIEKTPGNYDFSDIDWQIEEASKRGVKIVLAMGIKVPRWPECFIPDFYLENKTNREQALFDYEKVLVERFQSNENIIMWQVENEPFLPFGDCIDDAIDEELVSKEVELVKKLDSTRQVMVTDSGELSLWYQAAKRGDVFGTTMYRIIYKEPFGYVHYPLSPNFFRIKAQFIKYFANQENVIIAELQAEPWGTGDLKLMSVEDQYRSMSPEKFDEIIDYAKRTNFSESYLWGAEWWYWMKEVKGKPEMWESAKKVLQGK